VRKASRVAIIVVTAILLIALSGCFGKAEKPIQAKLASIVGKVIVYLRNDWTSPFPERSMLVESGGRIETDLEGVGYREYEAFVIIHLSHQLIMIIS
jgi:hypothetical protein